MVLDRFAELGLSDGERKIMCSLAVLDEPEAVRNPFTGESAVLCPEAVAVYDFIKGAEMLGDYASVEAGLAIFMRVWPEEYMILLD